MEPPVIQGKPPAAKDWRCADTGCNTLLGKRHSHGTLILKYKDFLAEVSGNYNVTAHCRRCGLSNTLTFKSHGVLDLVKDNG